MDQKKPATPSPPAPTPQPAHESPMQHLLHGADYTDLLKQIANELAAGVNELRNVLAQLRAMPTAHTPATQPSPPAKAQDISHAQDSPRF